MCSLSEFLLISVFPPLREVFASLVVNLVSSPPPPGGCGLKSDTDDDVLLCVAYIQWFFNDPMQCA